MIIISIDPHYYSWDNSYFDFQGGCDQIAIDNDIFQLQIRTRPRGYYSAVTEAVLKFKQTSELFRIGVDSASFSNSLTSASGVTYDNSVLSYSNRHTITFNDAYSFIRFNLWYGQLSIQVFGHGSYFCGSEGMFGSWNNGGVRFPDGTPFDLSGGYAATRITSIALAQAWMVPVADSSLTNPSDVCVASSSCGPTDAFECTDTRRLRALQTEPCDNTDCTHIQNDILRGACEEDLILSGYDTQWTCQPSYIDPVIIESDTCDFEKPNEGTCYSVSGDTCARMDGYCKPKNCQSTDTHICLPGICGSDEERCTRTLTHTLKSSKSSKSSKASTNPVDCICFVPTKC